MNVLSLFDGMSCGQIALKQLGIKVDKYYASEIDKYAIQIEKLTKTFKIKLLPPFYLFLIEFEIFNKETGRTSTFPIGDGLNHP